MEWVPVVMAVIGGISSISAGSKQKEMYEVQAQQERTLAQLRANQDLQAADLNSTQTRLQATQARIEHERTASDVMRRINAVQAAIVARSAAGGVRSFEGSAAKVFAEQGFLGAREFDISMENARLAEQFGFLQADNLKAGAGAQTALDLAGAEAGASVKQAAGSIAQRQGLMKGLMSFGQAGFSASKLSTPRAPQPKAVKPSLIGDFELRPYAYG